MNTDDMTRELAKAAHAFSVPINFEELIKKGLLEKRGRSYYVKNIHKLPEIVSKRIKTATETKNGIRVAFHKESKSLSKIAKKLKDYLD